MGETVVDAFLEQVRSSGDRVAFRHRVGDEWQTISWAEYGERVRRAAAGLRAAGVDSGDRVAILSGNRWEWHVADIAAQMCGAATAPVYTTNSPRQVAYITGHSESKVIFVENAGQLEKVLSLREEIPDLRGAVVFDPEGVALDDFVVSWDALLSEGDAFDAANPGDVDAHAGAVRPDDICTLVYTSGTTGPPKGAVLTHGNIVWTCEALSQVLRSEPTERRLSYLPLSHVAERVSSHFQQIELGFETWFARSIETLREDLQACRPTVFFGVPRVWEKFYAGIMGLIEGLPSEQREGAERAIRTGLEKVDVEQSGASMSPELEERYREADAKLFALARAALGLDQARALVSGAAPINRDVLRFFHAIGLPVAEVYGQTEDCGPTSINRMDRIKIGTVGPPLPGVEVRIASDGEILARGPNVGKGYFKDPRATRDLIDEDGWMHSGDIGEFDEDGYLRITDRKKDLIITAAGKNIAPQVIENMLTYSPWISQAVVIGDRRPYLVALLTLDTQKVGQFARDKGIAFGDFAELTQHPDVLHLVEEAVADVNRNLARVEQVKRYRVLEREFEMDQGEVTPTLKIRRRAIIDKSVEMIDGLYS